MYVRMVFPLVICLLSVALGACGEHTVGPIGNVNTKDWRADIQLECTFYNEQPARESGDDVIYEMYTVGFDSVFRVYDISTQALTVEDYPFSVYNLKYKRKLDGNEYNNTLAFFASVDFNDFPAEVPEYADSLRHVLESIRYTITLRTTPGSELKGVVDYIRGNQGVYPAGFESLREELFAYVFELRTR